MSAHQLIGGLQTFLRHGREHYRRIGRSTMQKTRKARAAKLWAEYESRKKRRS